MKKTAGSCVILGLALVATVALAWGPGFGPIFWSGFWRAGKRGSTHSGHTLAIKERNIWD
jgi:hypothetical protein